MEPGARVSHRAHSAIARRAAHIEPARCNPHVRGAIFRIDLSIAIGAPLCLLGFDEGDEKRECEWLEGWTPRQEARSQAIEPTSAVL
jgi:hypothetical protein